MAHRDARLLAAALEGIVGWEWLVSGANKIYSGGFPSGLAAALNSGLKDNPNGWYVAFLQRAILPHSVFFGYLIEFGEILIGVALLIGAIGLLGALPRRGAPQHRLAVTQVVVALLGALACIVLCVNFHFYMGDGLIPGINPTNAFDEGIDLDTLMPLLALVIAVFNLSLLSELFDVPLRALPGAMFLGVRRLIRREPDGWINAPLTRPESGAIHS